MQGRAGTVTASLGGGQWPPSVWRAQVGVLPAYGQAGSPGTAASQCKWPGVPGYISAWAGKGGQSLPCRRPHRISSTHLVCLPHPSIVSNVLPKCAEAVHLHTRDRMAGSTPHRGGAWSRAGRGLGGRGALRARSRSAAPPAPRSSSRTGGSCTPTASGSAGPRSCSTSPACCHSCRSSGLGGGGGGLSGRPCQPSTRPPLPVLWGSQ